MKNLTLLWPRPVLLVSVLLGLVTCPVRAADPPPPVWSTELVGVPLQLLVRTSDGTPVPGIQVDLVPAAPDAGGPPVGTPAQHAITDGRGMVVFAPLQGAIWWAGFQGTYQGQPLVPLAAQGKPPYGTTRGGGLVVQTAVQEENDAPAPVVGQPAPAVETLAFVLLPTGAEWTPAIDLAAPDAAPHPLARTAAPTELTFVSPPAAEFGAVQDTKRGPDLTLVWWLLPVGAAGGALFVTWRQRQIERSRHG